MPVKPGTIPEEIMERIKELQKTGGDKNSPLFVLNTCRAGQSGCPNSLYDVKGLAEKIKIKAQEGHFSERLEQKYPITGNTLYHHRFQACLAGCPNACSQPQIKDFGLIGQRKPDVSEEVCIQCMKCVEACLENAIEVMEAGPVFDYSKCISCGQCQLACPTGTIIIDSQGLRVMAGGKLGRHPKLAENIAEFAAETEALVILENLIELFLKEGKEGERVGALLERKNLSL